MIQEYRFWHEEPILFDDRKSVRELISYVFDQFDYYEPFGMDIVTVFQCHHPATSTGWFTTDVERSCAEEILTRDWLCFAYNMPGVFYFADGGWGHHMTGLGNHPHLDNPVSIKLQIESSQNTVVFAGDISFRQIITALKRTEYISKDLTFMKIHVCDYPRENQMHVVDFQAPVMDAPLTEFKQKLPDGQVVTIILE